MKWEPVAAMIALLVLGVWLVAGLAKPVVVGELRPGAAVVPFTIGNTKGVLEGVPPGEGEREKTYRLLFRNGESTGVLTQTQLEVFLPRERVDRLNSTLDQGGSFRRGLFRILNITGWWGLLWVTVGFAGQAAFFGRMLVQWMVSERQKRSTVPEIFWWLSLFGGIALFTYFVWRQDVVGVIGQTTGVVIYARNLRLIAKRRRRAERQIERARLRREQARAAGATVTTVVEERISVDLHGFIEDGPESDR